MDSLKISKLKQRFSKVKYFTGEDLRTFYDSSESIISKETFRSRIYRLVKMGVLQRIGHGTYSLGGQIIFEPIITKATKRIYKTIHAEFPFAITSIWHTSVLNEFMIHQAFKYNLIVEVEKDAAEPIFYFLKEKYKNVYLNPGMDIYQNYIVGKTDSIIVKSLISEAPTQLVDDVITPTLEKILVDIYCDKIIYSPFQGKEMKNIFENSFEKYTVNLSTLSRYAFRRGKKEEIAAYIQRLK